MFECSTLICKNNINRLVGVLLILLASFGSAFAQSWTKADSISPFVNKIYFPQNMPGTVIVSSDDIETKLDESPVKFAIIGSGYRISTDSGKTFSEKKMQDTSVFDIIQDPLNLDNWFASVRSLTRGGIAVSTNNAAGWQSGNLKCEASYQMWKIIPAPTDVPKYYAACINTRYGFLTSTEGFQNCQQNTTLEVQTRDLAVSPVNNSLMFLAADGVYQSGCYRSYDGGASWLKDEQGLDAVNVFCVLPSSLDEAVVFCGSGSGGIYSSIDTGKTWQQLPNPTGKVYSIVSSPSNMKYIAAACGTGGVWLSGSYGWSWELIGGLPEGSDVRQIAIAPWAALDDKFVLFAGVYNDGLYRSDLLTTSADEPLGEPGRLKIISVLPQPAESSLSITFYNPTASYIRIELKDIFGRPTVVAYEGFESEGVRHISCDVSCIGSASIYYAIITSGTCSAVQKIIIAH